MDIGAEEFSDFFLCKENAESPLDLLQYPPPEEGLRLWRCDGGVGPFFDGVSDFHTGPFRANLY